MDADSSAKSHYPAFSGQYTGRRDRFGLIGYFLWKIGSKRLSRYAGVKDGLWQINGPGSRQDPNNGEKDKKKPVVFIEKTTGFRG